MGANFCLSSIFKKNKECAQSYCHRKKKEAKKERKEKNE